MEAILQVWMTQPKSRIAVAAPSNSAVDVLAQRLINHLEPGNILTLWAEIPKAVYHLEKIRVLRGMNFSPVQNKLIATVRIRKPDLSGLLLVQISNGKNKMANPAVVV